MSPASFYQRLHPVHIHVALTKYGKNLGICASAPVQCIEIHSQCWNGAAAHHQAIGNTTMPDAAWVVLHEMIHLAIAQAGLESRGADDNCHATPICAAWCNFIAEHIYLPLAYAQNKRGKAKADSDGIRKNIWKPTIEPAIRPGTCLATYDETGCFPYLSGDRLMQDNLEQRQGQEPQLPQF